MGENWGRNGRETAVTEWRWAQAGRLVEVERCSHWVQHDASDELHKEMDAFLLQLAKAE